MLRPRVAILALGLALVLQGTAVRAAGEDADAPSKSDTAQHLQDIEKQIEEGRSHSKELTGKAEKIAKESDTLQQQLIETASQVQDLEVRVTALEDKIKSLAQEEAEKKKDLDARRGELSRLLAGSGMRSSSVCG